MSCLAITDVMCLEGKAEEALQIFRQMIPGAREDSGSEGVEIYRNQDNPNNITWIEHWKLANNTKRC